MIAKHEQLTGLHRVLLFVWFARRHGMESQVRLVFQKLDNNSANDELFVDHIRIWPNIAKWNVPAVDVWGIAQHFKSITRNADNAFQHQLRIAVLVDKVKDYELASVGLNGGAGSDTKRVLPTVGELVDENLISNH